LSLRTPLLTYNSVRSGGGFLLRLASDPFSTARLSRDTMTRIQARVVAPLIDVSTARLTEMP